MRVSRRYLLVLGTFCLSVLLYVDRVGISAAQESVARDLGLSDRQMGWVLSSFALGYALCQTPAGWLADRFGPRLILTMVVVFWSAFTGLTAVASGLAMLLAVRFLFGGGEAGAFPGMARAAYSWIPMQERGIVQGINFSGSRVGAALALPALAAVIGACGWRMAFAMLMVVGFGWAAFWYWWFRDDPAELATIDPAELAYILAHRQTGKHGADLAAARLPLRHLLRSADVWLLCLQYFCSNFTFFFCLTWLLPHLKNSYALGAVEAGLYSSVPLFCGALGNWFSGWLVDRLYGQGRWVLSRRTPAVAGFALTAIGLLGCVHAETALLYMVWFSIAVFGADMTLPPSWVFCIDIGKHRAGVVSGTMNMAGNLGAFLTALAFPYLAQWTGSSVPFFYVAAGLCGVAIAAWMAADPRRSLEVAV